ncbi:MAG: AgmX/PglI C-terminal domain-containing protein [Nitrospirae bacterium]|nr:AgmX/PglI C-terminal domain-containing protein [Nitrospirota bacterium]MBI3351566.1 AgmX/PglI C-terminal domain-containing protein [Nitrospirota bacterium]
MNSRQSVSYSAGEREFHLFLIGSFLFYALLVFIIYEIPIENLRPASPKYSTPRKIIMAIPPPPAKPVPLPVRPEIKKILPVPIVPKKTKKPSSPPMIQPKEKPQPPPESPEEIERKRQAQLALQQARELEKNKEIARNKFASVFGNTTEEVLRNKGANVITTNKGAPALVKKENPDGISANDFQGIDQILKGIPGGETGKKATLGEHQTKLLSGGGGGNGSGGNGPVGSTRTPEDVERAFNAYIGRLKATYDKIIQTRPDFKGKMKVNIIIAADGHVAKCEILSSGLGDKKFESEIAQIIQDQFKFSKIIQGEESVLKDLSFNKDMNSNR